MKNATKKTIILSSGYQQPKNQQEPHGSQQVNLQKSQPIKTPVFFISVLGTVLEYFEYAIYGFLAPILALHFFPEGNPEAALLKAFGVFAVGSLSKPLGALIFGYLGDRRGRRVSLRYSMIGISFPTFVVGMLPGYESWGWVSAFALVLCRMCQGIFLAGESDGVRIYVFEHLNSKYLCLLTTLVGCGAYIGIAMASFVASCIPATGESWRFVFLGCSVFALVIFILRRYLIETPAFLAYQKTNLLPPPLRQVIQTNWKAILWTIMICGANGGTYHFYLVFQGTYLSKILGILPELQGSSCGFYLTCAYVLTLPLAALAADLWGLTRVSKIGGIATIGFIALNIMMIMEKVVFFPVLLGTTVCVALFSAPGYLFLIQQYTVDVRFRCLSLGHTIGSMLFSGTTPFLCLLLWQKTALPYVPYLYFSFLVSMGITAFMWGEKEAKARSQRGSLSS